MTQNRYRRLDTFYREKFGEKIFKVSVDAGFSCPNKDGKKSYGGCVFCNGSAGIGARNLGLVEQFEEIKAILHKKWPQAKYIPFLEANTNTYADVQTLKEIYGPLLEIDGVVGLAIATRCDSIMPDVYEYLNELNKRTYLSIELGLQSLFDDTLRLLNRGHTRDEFTDCVKELRKRDIDVVVHVINGLPGETPSMMLDTIRYINSLDVQGIKFHMLYIEEGTRLADIYKEKPFSLLSREEYIKILAKQLEILDRKIVVHRLVSGPDNRKLIQPKWLLGKFTNLNAIEKYLEDNDIRQGSKS